VHSINFQDLNEEFVEITIEDNGPGLPRDDPEKIFEWYYTTKQDKVAKGLGFGLAWSRTLVEVEGGRITAENIEEGGARFKVRYPVTFKKYKESLV
jgi:K+-sensing histidine kinase KdpD